MKYDVSNRLRHSNRKIVVEQRFCVWGVCRAEKKRADNRRDNPACYRLCVYASGSWITDIFSSLTLIKLSCLHLWQNKGKFFSSVSLRTLFLVLFPQIGHLIHSVGSNISTDIELASALSFIIIHFFTPCTTAQLIDCAGTIWLKIERLTLIALVDEVLQGLAGVP